MNNAQGCVETRREMRGVEVATEGELQGLLLGTSDHAPNLFSLCSVSILVLRHEECFA